MKNAPTSSLLIMNLAIVTGSSGLIGGEAVAHFSNQFDLIVGIDNNMRAPFFGAEASTEWGKKDF